MFSCLAKIRFAHQVEILFYKFHKFQSNLLVYKIELLFLSLAKPSGNCSKWNNDDSIKTGPFQGKIIFILILAKMFRHQFYLRFLFLTGIFFLHFRYSRGIARLPRDKFHAKSHTKYNDVSEDLVVRKPNILDLQPISRDTRDNVSHPRWLVPTIVLIKYSFVLYHQHGRRASQELE